MIRTILALSLSGVLFACGGTDHDAGADPQPAEQNGSEPGEQSEDALYKDRICITMWCSHPAPNRGETCTFDWDSGHTFVRITCF